MGGHVERGKTIFEGLLANYPKRTDLWSVYLDAHIKASTSLESSAHIKASTSLESSRELFERCVSLSLKPFKMKFFFKRWLDFEKKHGDESSQQDVKVKARAFVESISQKP